MSRSELVVLWLGITALCCALAIPPYGYDSYDQSFIWPNSDPDESTERVPWRYVGHGFVFGSAPVAEINGMVQGNGVKQPLMISTFAHTKIAWWLLAIELVCIVVITLGALATTRSLARRAR